LFSRPAAFILINICDAFDREVKMDIIRVLRAWEEVEGKMAALYRQYGQWFLDDAEAGDLFNRISMQETAHRNVISFEIKMVSQNRGSFGEVDVELEPIVQFAATVSRAQTPLTPPSLEEAVRLALKLEQQAAAEHFCTLLTRQGNPGMEAMIKSMHNMRAANHAHLAELQSFAAARGFLPHAAEAVAAPAPPAE
jgi:hypothetical protein